MWTHEYTREIPAPSETVWRLLADVEGWVEWNDGIASIALDGPLAVGTRFRMTPPGEPTLTSTIVELEPGRVLTEATAVTYRITVSGAALPDGTAAEIGTAVSADFPDVLDGLARLAASSR